MPLTTANTPVVPVKKSAKTKKPKAPKMPSYAKPKGLAPYRDGATMKGDV